MPIKRKYHRQPGRASFQIRTSVRRRLALGETVTAITGDNATPPRVSVTSRAVSGDIDHLGQIYVRLPNNDGDDNDSSTYSVVREAINLSPRLNTNASGIPVLVKQVSRTDTRLIIQDVDIITLRDGGIDPISYNLLAQENILKPLRDMQDFRVQAQGNRDVTSTTILIPDNHAYAFLYGGSWRILNSDYTVDVASAIPSAGEERLVFVYYDADADSLTYTQGTVRDIEGLTWDASDFDNASSGITANILPGAFYVLSNAEPTVTEANRQFDVRQWFTTVQPSQPSGVFPALLASYVSKSANYTVTNTDGTIGVDCSGGSVTITLLDASSVSGRVFNVYAEDVSGGIVTIDTTSSQTINGSTSVNLFSQYESLTLQSNGSNWVII